jgi:hypothetical protein
MEGEEKMKLKWFIQWIYPPLVSAIITIILYLIYGVKK